jgi:hypothetical protein
MKEDMVEEEMEDPQEDLEIQIQVAAEEPEAKRERVELNREEMVDLA